MQQCCNVSLYRISIKHAAIQYLWTPGYIVISALANSYLNIVSYELCVNIGKLAKETII